MDIIPTVTLAAAGSGAGQLMFMTSGRSAPGTIGTNTAQWITTSKFSVGGTGYTAAFTIGDAIQLWLSTGGTVYSASAEL